MYTASMSDAGYLRYLRYLIDLGTVSDYRTVPTKIDFIPA